MYWLDGAINGGIMAVLIGRRGWLTFSGKKIDVLTKVLYYCRGEHDGFTGSNPGIRPINERRIELAFMNVKPRLGKRRRLLSSSRLE